MPYIFITDITTIQWNNSNKLGWNRNVDNCVIFSYKQNAIEIKLRIESRWEFLISHAHQMCCNLS